MAELKPKPESAQEASGKKESMIGFIAGMLVLTIVAIGAGWFLGDFIIDKKPDSKAQSAAFIKVGGEKDKSKDAKKGAKSEKKNKGKGHKSNILRMEPILVALRKSNNAFMRLELALVFHTDPSKFDEEQVLRLHSDLAAFARTISLRSISGPSGYIHFREDILDRARLASEGMIDDVLILSMVAE